MLIPAVGLGWVIGRQRRYPCSTSACLVFFFSSRRRHTRYWRDWSSDVCSSDLTLTIDKPEEALDEARRDAIAKARARAELYARATGKRVGRILSISEAGGYGRPYRSGERRGGEECRYRW